MTKAGRLLGGLVLLLCIICVGSRVCAQERVGTGEPPVSPQERASLAIKALQSWFEPKTGLYRTTGWWNSANAITTLADYTRATGDRQFAGVFPVVFAAAQKTSPGFLNDYYDDEGWWALAWVGAYDVTHEQRYLAMAESIFADMAASWDDTCSGGIWWSKERKYKNAIANELFLSVAAHLAARSSDEKEKARYRDWAEREWKWFAHTGMINAGLQVNDGLVIGADGKCANNGKTTWSYNQGVVLGGLAELYGQTRSAKLLDEANAIAAATLMNPVLIDKNGILHEPCEPDCGADGTQFKGIFMRNLAALDQAAPNASYRDFILKNAESVWSAMKPPAYEIGTSWSAPYGKVNASTQSSGVDALVAAVAVGSR
ncbi:glycoside hydrolase family 76 protein [Occallatibacter savannae]|uniref:glycoside hydrolase family 76 protein n=1 Tax=Occallatibacter savannae TaxID=1002691 RepID=UPI0013A584A1|nr:glycoside hydrolase family 76 protein [Occallatibacter savannae]